MATETLSVKITNAVVATAISLFVLAMAAMLVDVVIPPAKQELVCGKTGISILVGADGTTCQIRTTTRIYGNVGHAFYSYNGVVAEGMEHVDVSNMPRVEP